MKERREKLKRRIAQRPKHVRFEELEKLLKAYGFELRKASGSHRIYKRGRHRLVVPYRRPHLLPIYVKRALEIIEEVEREERDEEG